MIDILKMMKDLQIQATTERSHYYVKAVLSEAIVALEEAKEIMFDIEQGKDPSFYIKEWLAKYFQDNQKEGGE